MSSRVWVAWGNSTNSLMTHIADCTCADIQGWLGVKRKKPDSGQEKSSQRAVKLFYIFRLVGPVRVERKKRKGKKET